MRLLVCIATPWLLTLVVSSLAAAQETSQSPETDDITLRIVQLGHDSFAVRQAATAALMNAPPEAIGQLKDAVRSDDPEVRTRALGVLLSMARGRSDRHLLPAHRALASLADDEIPAVARRAGAALAELQEDAAQEFTRMGCMVHFNARRRVDFIAMNEAPVGDEHVARLLLLRDLEMLNLSRTRITSAGLVRLTDLPRLATLELRYTAIDNAAIGPLAHLPDLYKLNLQGAKIDDVGAAHLADLTRLKSLSVERTAITDRGLESLCNLARLETLYLGESPIAGTALAHLARLPQLKYLSLRDLDLRDEHIAALGVCTQLESLGLDETPVTSACLEHLRHLPQLRVLWLTNSQVDDAGVATLASMKSLKNLHVRGTKLTKPAVDELRKQLPGVEISY